MLSAAREALRCGAVAAAPCSGFHHAGYDKAEGFCTFNGLMVTACVLRHENSPTGRHSGLRSALGEWNRGHNFETQIRLGLPLQRGGDLASRGAGESLHAGNSKRSLSLWGIVMSFCIKLARIPTLTTR